MESEVIVGVAVMCKGAIVMVNHSSNMENQVSDKDVFLGYL